MPAKDPIGTTTLNVTVYVFDSELRLLSASVATFTGTDTMTVPSEAASTSKVYLMPDSGTKFEMVGKPTDAVPDMSMLFTTKSATTLLKVAVYDTVSLIVIALLGTLLVTVTVRGRVDRVLFTSSSVNVSSAFSAASVMMLSVTGLSVYDTVSASPDVIGVSTVSIIVLPDTATSDTILSDTLLTDTVKSSVSAIPAKWSVCGNCNRSRISGYRRSVLCRCDVNYNGVWV